MTQTQILLGKNQEHLDILNGFFVLKEYLKQKGVDFSTLELINKNVKKAYYKHNSFSFPFKLLPNDILLVDNKKIPLFSSRLNFGSDSFNISSIYNQQDGFQLDGLTSTMSNSGDPTLEGIATGLNLLDGLGLDIEVNINNVLTYGLDSWNATTSPEGIQTKINELALYMGKVLSLKDPSESITLYNKQAKRLLTYYKHLRSRHAKATSTKKAYDKMIKTLNTFIEQESQLVSKLKPSGYKFNITQKTVLGVENIFKDTGGHVVGTDADNKRNPFKTTYNEYVLVRNESTNTSSINSKSNLATVVGVSALAWFIVPKLINYSSKDQPKQPKDQPK